MASVGRLISVSTVLFDGYHMEHGLAEMAKAGVRHVEPAYIKGYLDFDETAFSAASATVLSRQLAQNDLRVHGVSAHMNLSDTDALDMLHRRVDFAARLGAKVVIVNSGPLAWATKIIKTVDQALPHLERTGLVLALENPGHGRNDMLGNAQMGRHLVEQIGSPQCRLNYDAGNVFTYSKCSVQPADDLADHFDLVANLHLKDIAVAGGDWQFTALGDGAVDYASFWPLVPQDMPVTLELPLRLERPNGADPVRRQARVPMAELRNALETSLAWCHAQNARQFVDA